MPRPPRLHFAGANYHIVTRSDGRRKLFHDDGHYERFTDGLRQEVVRSGWIVLAYCWMSHHVHALIQTPESSLARGMQHWLSGYANWYAKRNQRTGHLYQGRYKAFLVEDAGYDWTLSRYIHLNPCVGGKPLATTLESWPHSSMPGYARRSKRVDWVQYDPLHTHCSAAVDGKDAAGAYRRYVNEGLVHPVDPLKQQLREWVFGSEGFLHRMIALAEGGERHRHESTIRRVHAVTVTEVLEATASHHGVDRLQYAVFRSETPGRDMACVVAGQMPRSGNSVRPLGLPAPTASPTWFAVPSNSPSDPPVGE